MTSPTIKKSASSATRALFTTSTEQAAFGSFVANGPYGVVTVKAVDSGAKTVAVKTAEGGDETYHLAGRAAKETGKGLEKTGKVTVYYTEEGGKRIVHWFEGH